MRTIQSAEIVLPAPELEATLKFFVDELGFQLVKIFPADSPRVAVIEGFGVRLRLDASANDAPGRLRLKVQSQSRAGENRTAPNGTQIEWTDADGDVELPALKPEYVISRQTAEAHWSEGRAGMRYRDLIPSRLGGRFIASHIHIAEGGPVPDYVHFHQVRFQLIYCWQGWVKVVYQDQGDPFVLNPGDCVLQPPGIRHRVLECSNALDVIELGSPAEHETGTDTTLGLPNDATPGKTYAGQDFVRHQAGKRWGPWRHPGFEAQETAISQATHGMASVRRVRSIDDQSSRPESMGGEFYFLFVLAGAMTLDTDLLGGASYESQPLDAGDSVVIPTDTRFRLAPARIGCEFLEVHFPA